MKPYKGKPGLIKEILKEVEDDAFTPTIEELDEHILSLYRVQWKIVKAIERHGLLIKDNAVQVRGLMSQTHFHQYLEKKDVKERTKKYD